MEIEYLEINAHNEERLLRAIVEMKDQVHQGHGDASVLAVFALRFLYEHLFNQEEDKARQNS